MHICPICNRNLDDSEFCLSKVTNLPIGRCKTCRQKYQKEYDKNRAEQRKEYAKDRYYNKGGREKRIQSYANMSQEQKDKINEQKRLDRLSWSKEKLEQTREKSRNYYKNNREQELKRSQNYRLKTNYNKKYYEQNKEIILQKRKENYDINKNKLNRGIYNALNKFIKHGLDTNILNEIYHLNYTFQDFKQYIEKQFTSEMNWDNYGIYWELDHIVPLVKFNFEKPEDRDFQICWSLNNLRPLTIKENRSRPKDGSDISEYIKNKIMNI